jgi:cyanophycinase
MPAEQIMARIDSILGCPDSAAVIASLLDRGRIRFWLAWSLAFVVGVCLRGAILPPSDDGDFEWDDRLSALEKPSESADVPSLQQFLNPPGIHTPKTVGSLVVCGGGRVPDAIREEFLKLAGGDQAKLVVIPTGSETAGALTEQAQHRRLWDALHPATIDILHTRSRDAANSDKFVAPLRKATGVWIGGGRQSLIAAAYTGTRVERELHALLTRGGVIGGTSAGAACQSRIMIVRGEVHDVPGLGLLPGTIIDQHFVVRGRKGRLLAALDKHPQWLGVGVDEQAALVVQGANLRCVGDSSVTLCVTPTAAGETRELVLKPGDTADLHEWRRKAGQR